MREIIIAKNFAIDEVSEFRDKVYEMINNGEKNFILDCSKCEFIDSTGLGVLVALYKKCNELNGSLRLHSVNSEVMRVFNLTRLDTIFKL